MSVAGDKIENDVHFDTDSKIVGINNRASVCISDDINDFIGEMKEVSATINGFHGSKVYKVQIGTIKWNIEDDHGVISTFKIPKSYYVPEGRIKLFSP